MLHTFGRNGGRFAMINRLLHTERLVPTLLAPLLLVGAVALCPARAEAALSVAVIEAVRSEGYAVERAYGGELRARRSSTLGFRHPGEVVRVLVDDGDPFAAGALLAELDPEPLQAQVAQARARLVLAGARQDVAAAALELAEETTLRFTNLLEAGHTSEQRYDEARLDLAGRRAELAVSEAAVVQAEADLRIAELDLERSRIHAPYAGRVQARFADEGAIVLPGQQVLRIIETGHTEARIGLPQDVAETLEMEHAYTVRVGRESLEATLATVLPEVDDRTRTVTAIFTLAGATLPAGSSAELTLRRPVASSGFWLPLSSLTEAQRGLWAVYVLVGAQEESVTERRLVEVLHTERDRVFVQGTLHDGDRIVSTGTQRIVPGQTVRGVAAR